MLSWQINTRTPQTTAALRAELERERDHFLLTHRPDAQLQALTESLIKATGPARDQIERALNDYIAQKPTDAHQVKATEQIDGAIEGACRLAESMTRRLTGALVHVTLCGHVDDDRGDGIDQRVAINVDFAPMPRMAREDEP